MRLNNARGFHSGPQDILLSWDVGGLGYPVQIVQVAERRTQRKGHEEGWVGENGSRSPVSAPSAGR